MPRAVPKAQALPPRPGWGRGESLRSRDLGNSAAGLPTGALADEILYDGVLPRSIKPNPGGRVFSASGEELVADTLGHTLAYWEGDTLILETDPPNGGKVIEKITVKNNPRQLLYQIKLQMRILKEPVEIKRVFEPATETHSAVQ